MIAIGRAIGTGLFLGAGGRLAGAGPALALVFAICGVFAFFILRSLGELVLHRPSSGSFVSCARKFYGEKFAYVAGWMYFLNWAMTSIVDVTAVPLYLHYWSFFTSAPQWLLVLIKVVALVDHGGVLPRVINTVILCIAIFYVGSIVLLSLLLPYTAFSANESPFVTFFSSLGNSQTGAIAGSVMNFVVLTAALSSLNAGLYSTGRVLHSMGLNGSALGIVAGGARSCSARCD